MAGRAAIAGQIERQRDVPGRRKRLYLWLPNVCRTAHAVKEDDPDRAGLRALFCHSRVRYLCDALRCAAILWGRGHAIKLRLKVAGSHFAKIPREYRAPASPRLIAATGGRSHARRRTYSPPEEPQRQIRGERTEADRAHAKVECERRHA